MDINSIFSGTMTHLARLTLAGLIALVPASAAGQRSSRPVDLSALSHSLQRVVTKVAPAVVQIRVAAYGPVAGGSTGPSALLGTQRSTGSGLVVSPTGSS
jgi:S1-C subfamily serine protease